MKRNTINKSILSAIILVLIVGISGCGGSKEKNSDQQISRGTVDTNQSTTTKAAKNTKLSKFQNEPLVALQLHALDREATYDADAPVTIRLELYSPRSFAILDHNQYRSKTDGQTQLPTVNIEKLDRPWWQELKLTVTSPEGTSGQLAFHASYFSQQDTLDLGQGEVGSVDLIIEENSFPHVGKFNLKATWNSSKYGLIQSELLAITLVKGHLSDENRDLLRAKAMLARKDNGQALELTTKLAQHYPNSYAIRYYLAESHEKTGNLKEALAQYQHALTLFPQEKPDEPWEPPVGLYAKIRELMEKLGNDKKQDNNEENKYSPN